MTSRGPLRRVCVCIPTYQERASLPGVVARLRSAVPLAEVLVIDDASPDGTGALAEDLAATDPQIHVLHRRAKEGLGPAYLAGFDWAAGRGYDAVVEMDADGSHQPEQLPALLAAAQDDGGADLVIGSRWVPGGSVHRWPLHRRGLSVGANTYVRLSLGIPVRDATAGFRVYRLPRLTSLLATPVASQGYCFQVDLTLRAVDAGLEVREVPIAFVERVEGASKMTDAIVREAVVRVGGWAWERRARQVREHLARRDRSRWHHLEEAT
ncbi:dolichol-phosphate mannosyltransferase [Serinicoccus sp. CNJ-927]|uniref:polyprenol monophosphomannose synthase n=1 Tax=Serinicoccus TaxID=265976 RepID=UPI0003B6F34D|nr:MULTISPECIES: polyprenol monophosphomannose synthase [Serinicoccus]OLT15938.1 dolichol-phosphate mannosyltransferase [Serinicoccus sp. CUA-874]OLT39440.1 dolichol-phosphate mannosyltransferase [Serinicoccus sp. CNJ-927]